jgi:hypothetical protein
MEVEVVKPVSQSYLTSLWNDEAFRKGRNDDRNTLTNRYSRRFTLLSGAEYMAAFGLGTLPTLFGISLSGRMLPAALRMKLRGAVPIGISTLAVLLILRGASLGIPYLSPDLSSCLPNAHCHSR